MRSLLVATLILPQGCSLALTRGPNARQPDAACTRSRAAPIVDTVIAVTAASVVAAAALQCATAGEDDETPCMFAAGGAIVLGLPTLIYGGSAWHGFRATGQCRAVAARTP